MWSGWDLHNQLMEKPIEMGFKEWCTMTLNGLENLVLTLKK
jgi:hypothetical protein